MKLIIAGSRGFEDILLMKIKMQTFTDENGGHPSEVISGAADGADTLGTQWAKLHDIPVRFFHPNWDEYGKSAGYRRNEEMANQATHLIAFHDGESRGTRHMIDIARRKELVVKVVNYNA